MLRMTLRILLYPTIPIITQTPNIIVAMDIYIAKRSLFWLVLVSFIATSIQGILNMVVFCTDPMIIPSLKEIFSVWRFSNNNGTKEVEEKGLYVIEQQTASLTLGEISSNDDHEKTLVLL